jgi:hypothetical protein
MIAILLICLTDLTDLHTINNVSAFVHQLLCDLRFALHHSGFIFPILRARHYLTQIRISHMEKA